MSRLGALPRPEPTDLPGVIRRIAERDDPSELVTLAALLTRVQETLTWMRDRAGEHPEASESAELVYHREPRGETTAAGQLRVVARLDIPALSVRAVVATNARGELMVRSSFRHGAARALIEAKRAEIAALLHMVETELGTDDVRDETHAHLELVASA